MPQRFKKLASPNRSHTFKSICRSIPHSHSLSRSPPTLNDSITRVLIPHSQLHCCTVRICAKVQKRAQRRQVRLPKELSCRRLFFAFTWAHRRLGRVSSHRHGGHVLWCIRLQPEPVTVGRVSCHRHERDVLWCIRLQPGPVEVGRVSCHCHVWHVRGCLSLQSQIVWRCLGALKSRQKQDVCWFSGLDITDSVRNGRTKTRSWWGVWLRLG